MIGHGAGTHWVSWSPDGSRLLSLGYDGALRLWDPGTGEQVGVLEDCEYRITLDGPDSPYTAWAADGKRLACATGDHIRVWDTGAGHEIAATAAGANAESVTWSPDGKWLAWDEDGRIRAWDPSTGEEVASAQADAKHAYCLAWSSEGRWLAWIADGNMMVWNASSGGAPVALNDGKTDPASHPDWRPRSAQLAFNTGHRLTNDHHYIHIWDAAAGSEVAALSGYFQPFGMDFPRWSPDGGLLTLAPSGPDSVWFVSPDTWQPVASLNRSDIRDPMGFIWSPDGGRLAIKCESRTIRIWEAAARREVASLSGVGPLSLVWSPDGRRLAWLTWDKVEDDVSALRTPEAQSEFVSKVGRVGVWDAATRRGRLIPALGSCNTFLDWSTDGRRLIAGGDRLRIWDFAAGRAAVTGGLPFWLADFAGSPAADRLAVVSDGGALHLWDLRQ